MEDLDPLFREKSVSQGFCQEKLKCRIWTKKKSPENQDLVFENQEAIATVSINDNPKCPKYPDDISKESDDRRKLNYNSALPSLSVNQYADNACHLTNLDDDLNMPNDCNFSYLYPSWLP